MKLLKFRFVPSLLTLTLVLALSGVLSINYAQAGALSVMSDTMSRQKISTASTHLIKFTTPSAINTNGNTIVIAFPSTFNFTGSVITDVTMKDGASTGLENTETLAASPSATAWGAVFTDGNCSASKKCTLTLTAPTDGVGAFSIVATSVITVAYTAANNTNPSSAGSQTITLTTTSDSGSIAVPIIGVGGTTDENEIITATVAPTITFTNDDSTIGFGTLSSSTQTYANSAGTGTTSDTTAHTLAIGTNAASGYTLTYNGATLTGVPSGTITAVGATGVGLNGTPGTSQFGISGQLTGTGTMSAQYDHATPKFAFVAGAPTTLSSSAGAASDSIAMRYLANILTTTPAGTYSTTLTYIVTGNF